MDVCTDGVDCLTPRRLQQVLILGTMSLHLKRIFANDLGHDSAVCYAGQTTSDAYNVVYSLNEATALTRLRALWYHFSVASGWYICV